MELKDINGCLNDHCIWVRSDKLITVANNDKLDDARGENLTLSKENTRLKGTLMKEQKSAEPKVPKATYAAASYDPQKNANQLSDGEASPLLINSA